METLKKILGALCISALLASIANASWLSDFLSSANISVTKEAGGYYKTQAGGFLTGGGVRIRWSPIGPIQFFNWQPPSVNVGCNGIDATWGSFSYMNFDQLVEKLKKLSTAAPAFATQLALSTLCKDCQAILGELEAVANAINSLNFDACEIAMNTAKNIGESLNSSVLSGTYKDFTDAAKNKITDAKGAVQEWAGRINAGIKNLDYAYNSPSNKDQQQGSIIHKVFHKFAEKKSYTTKTISSMLLKENKDDIEVENFIRALYGDFNGYLKDGIAQYEYIPPTIDVTNFIKTFWVGDENTTTISFQLYKDAKCDKDEGCKALEKDKMVELKKVLSFKEKNKENVKDIALKIKGNQALSDDNLVFINTQSIPLMDMLNLYASDKLGVDDDIVEHISLTMFKLAIEDMNSEIMQMISLVRADNSQGDARNRNLANYQDAINAFSERSQQFSSFFNAELQKQSQAIQDKSSLAKLIAEEVQRGFSSIKSN